MVKAAFTLNHPRQRFLNLFAAMPAGVKRCAPTLAIVIATLALASCGKPPAAQQDLDGLDKELTDSAGNSRDPALTAALHDQIMVDPALAQSANANVVRPPSRPDAGSVPPDGIGARADGVDPATLRHAPAAEADCPECKRADGALTLGELARRQANRGIADCAPRIGYSASWANRLPADLPLYPDARIAEAAGAQGCGLRIVSFASAAPMARVIDWYYTQARRAGYAAEHRTDGTRQVLGGTRGEAAYMLYVSPRAGGGSDVDLIVNTGT